MKPETRKIREINHWRRIKRNGNLLKKKKDIIDSINRDSNKTKLCSEWMHDNAKVDNESIKDTLNDSGIHTAGEKSNVNVSENTNLSESYIEDIDQISAEIYSATSECGYSTNSTNTYSGSDVDIVDGNQLKIRASLMKWAIEYQVRHNAVNELLAIIRNEFPFIDLPTDARTLVKTPRITTITAINGIDGQSGQYWHYGLKKVLTEAISCVSHTGAMFHLNINIDGLPMFRSSSNSFWPILVDIFEL